MELRTLTDTFIDDTVIDVFESLVWTERFTSEGDFKLVIPATPERLVNLSEGKFISLVGSPEIMMIESVLLEEGMITAAGKTLEAFFNERWIKIGAETSGVWKLRDTPGAILAEIVQAMVVASDYLDNPTTAATIGIGGDLNKIPNLVVGTPDSSGVEVTIPVPIGPMYDPMKAIAETYNIGMALHLSHADPFSYEFEFVTYSGVDRSSAQFDNAPIRFSPVQDTMLGVKELRSNNGFKTVVYAYPPSWSAGSIVVEYAPGTDPDATGFDRRVMVITTEDITADMVGGGVTLDALMHQKAVDALANNNYTKLVDGEVVPQPDYIYGQHYNLGDVVDLVGHSGVTQYARITEFIRSQDGTGERAYPTVSVIE